MLKETFLDSQGRIHARVIDEIELLEGRDSLFEDTKTELNSEIKPDYLLKLTLRGVSEENFTEESFPEVHRILAKYLKKFLLGSSKISEYRFENFHAKQKDTRIDDFVFNYGAKVSQLGELSIENIAFQSKHKGYVSVKVKNYCDPEEVWGVMTDLKKTDYALETPFCDKNAFFPNE
jgi:hypothetical protein